MKNVKFYCEKCLSLYKNKCKCTKCEEYVNKPIIIELHDNRGVK